MTDPQTPPLTDPHLSEPSESRWLTSLNWAYDQVLAGLPGVASSSQLAAQQPLQTCSTVQANRLIRQQVVKATWLGFVTGLGGFLLFPLTFSANLASIWFVQLRLIATLAHLSGFDLNDDEVRLLVLACLLGKSHPEVLQELKQEIGPKASRKVAGKVGVKVGFKLKKQLMGLLAVRLAKKTAIKLGKAVPVLGGLVAAGYDAYTTHAVGQNAKAMFVADEASSAL